MADLMLNGHPAYEAFKGLYSDFHDYGEAGVYTPNAGNLIGLLSGAAKRKPGFSLPSTTTSYF